MNGPIDVCFGREIYHPIRAVVSKQLPQRRPVADVRFVEGVVRIILVCLRNGGEVGGVGQLVDVDDRRLAVVE